MTTIANEKLRRIMREPRKPSIWRRVNPSFVIGAFLAGCVIYLVVTSQSAVAVVGECKPLQSLRVTA